MDSFESLAPTVHSTPRADRLQLLIVSGDGYERKLRQLLQGIDELPGDIVIQLAALVDQNSIKAAKKARRSMLDETFVTAMNSQTGMYSIDTNIVRLRQSLTIACHQLAGRT